jgi:hydrogenase expression/formation protein HypC
MCLGMPARIVELSGAEGCIAELGDERREISLALLADEPIAPGDWVYVHLGYAMERLTADEAREALETLALLEPQAETTA